jgi:hypothetical protein
MSTRKINPILPREHGSWFMFLIPLLLGALLTGFSSNEWLLIPSAFFAFLAITPATLLLKNPKQKSTYWNWLFFYLGVSAGIGVSLIPHHLGLLLLLPIIVLSFGINLYFIKKKSERHLLNDLFGTLALTLSFLAAYYVGKGHLDHAAFWEWAYLFLFFYGSSLHIKSLIRERKNPLMKMASIGYALGLLVLFSLLRVSIWVQAGQLISFIRVLALPQTTKLSVKVIGIIEIINAVLFGIFFTLAFWQKGS